MKLYAKKEEDLVEISHKFLQFFKDHHLFAFKGEMGVGKTTFISYLAKAMGVEDKVSSPTYGYINEYKSPIYGPIYHFDLYRLESIEEAYDIGIEEYIYDENIVFLEWPEKIRNILPDNCVWINITKNDQDDRVFEIDI